METIELRTAAALEARRRYAAERAANDPQKLDRARRVVRVAIARGDLTVDDLTGPEAA